MFAFDWLESRRMFAVTADAFHNTLYVWGDAGANGISVEKSGADLVVKRYVSGSGYVELFRSSDSYVNAVRIYGYDGPDTISVNDNVTDRTYIMGGRGADWIRAGGGENTVHGHGDWAADPSGSHNPATDDNATDTLIGGKGYNMLYGQNGNDTLFAAMSGATGASSYDMLFGGEGHDAFHTNGTGNAYCFGGNGNDTFKAGRQWASFYGEDGSDGVDFADFGEAIYARPDGATWSGSRTGTRNNQIQSTVEAVLGTQWADYFSGTNDANTFFGRAGNDTAYGHGGNDIILGEGGADRIYGGAGDDYLYGGDDNDVIYADAGNDHVFGGNGSDDIHGGAGNDNLLGEAGGDWIYGDAGNDKLVGGSGADYLHSHDGVAGNDTLFGDNENGTGGIGALDVAYVDRTMIGFFSLRDSTTGVESVSW
jgi:Ca2+-binding RTX toxin-like protein